MPLRFKHFPNTKNLDPDFFTTEGYEYLHNLETNIVERKLNLPATTENFAVEDAFLSGQLALLQELLTYSPYNSDEV